MKARTLLIVLGVYFFTGSSANVRAEEPSAGVAVTVPSVRVYPNPWRSDKHQMYPIKIDMLAPASDVILFTIAGQRVRRLSADSTGLARWELDNDSGDRVASGVYLYIATDTAGQRVRGKVAVIR